MMICESMVLGLVAAIIVTIGKALEDTEKEDD